MKALRCGCIDHTVSSDFKNPFRVLRELAYVPSTPDEDGCARGLVLMEGGLDQPHWCIFREDLKAKYGEAISPTAIAKAGQRVERMVQNFMTEHDCSGRVRVMSVGGRP